MAVCGNYTIFISFMEEVVRKFYSFKFFLWLPVCKMWNVEHCSKNSSGIQSNDIIWIWIFCGPICKSLCINDFQILTTSESALRSWTGHQVGDRHFAVIQGVHMRYEWFYSSITYQIQNIRMKSKWRWVCYMLKFVIHATWVSKCCHPLCYIHSAHIGVSSRKGKVCAVTSWGKVYGFCEKKISETFARRVFQWHAISTGWGPSTFSITKWRTLLITSTHWNGLTGVGLSLGCFVHPM